MTNIIIASLINVLISDAIIILVLQCGVKLGKIVEISSVVIIRLPCCSDSHILNDSQKRVQALAAVPAPRSGLVGMMAGAANQLPC